MLELHTGEHGYTDPALPGHPRHDVCHRSSLPEEDLFRCTPNDLFLIPTSEVL